MDKVTLDKAESLPPRSALCRVGDQGEANEHIYSDSGSDKRPEETGSCYMESVLKGSVHGDEDDRGQEAASERRLR